MAVAAAASHGTRSERYERRGRVAAAPQSAAESAVARGAVAASSSEVPAQTSGTLVVRSTDRRAAVRSGEQRAVAQLQVVREHQ